METIRRLEKAEDCSVWSLLYAGVLRRDFNSFLCVLWLIVPGGCSGRYTKGLAAFGSQDCWVRIEDLVWCESLMQDIAEIFWNLLPKIQFRGCIQILAGARAMQWWISAFSSSFEVSWGCLSPRFYFNLNTALLLFSEHHENFRVLWKP